MSHPQVALFALGTTAHAYLEFDQLPRADAGQLVATVAALATGHDSTTG